MSGEFVLAFIATVIAVASFILSVVNMVDSKRQAKAQAEEQLRQYEEQVKAKDRSDRLLFLQNVIFDVSIPRSSRQIFYDEYIGLGGNGTVIRFWLTEEKREEVK